MALRLVQAVNCEAPPVPGEACGTCRTCSQINRMEHADLIVVRPEDGGVLKVEQVRDLQHFVSLAPYASNYRAALLLNFEQANTNAQNALLKTLEEPNPKVLMLVTVGDAENLLPTITSRCELIRLRPMAVDGLSALLQESGKADAERSALIAHLSGGRVGYAYRLLEDTEYFARRTAWMNDLLELIRSGKNARIQYSHRHTSPSIIERAKAKMDLDEMMTFWLPFWRDVMLSCSGSSAMLTNIDLESAISRIAQAVQPQEAERAVHSLEHAFVRLQSANLQLMLDNILLGWPIVQF